MQVYSLSSEPQGKPKNTGVGSPSLLQRILQIQESNRGLPHCTRILYQLRAIREAHQSGHSPTIKLMQKLYKVLEVRLEIQEAVLEIHSTNAEYLLCEVTLLCATQALKIH